MQLWNKWHLQCICSLCKDWNWIFYGDLLWFQRYYFNPKILFVGVYVIPCSKDSLVWIFSLRRFGVSLENTWRNGCWSFQYLIQIQKCDCGRRRWSQHWEPLKFETSLKMTIFSWSILRVCKLGSPIFRGPISQLFINKSIWTATIFVEYAKQIYVEY